jgi:hypothetical protein
MGSQINRAALAAKTLVGVVAGLVLLANAADAAKPKKQPVAPPAPPPAPMIEIPHRPWIPEQPPATLITPPKDASGVRQTVNVGVSPMQRTWNLRSAYNVAALNCRDAKHAAILVNYKSFLKTHAKGLTAANRAVDAEFRAKHGAGFVKHREAYMTRVYNFYALPPTTPAFCNAALAMSEDAKKAKVGTLNAFALTAIPNLDIVNLDFYNRYDQWKLDGAAWDAKYAALYLSRYGKMYPGSSLPSAPVAAAATTAK